MPQKERNRTGTMQSMRRNNEETSRKFYYTLRAGETALLPPALPPNLQLHLPLPAATRDLRELDLRPHFFPLAALVTQKGERIPSSAERN